MIKKLTVLFSCFVGLCFSWEYTYAISNNQKDVNIYVSEVRNQIIDISKSVNTKALHSDEYECGGAYSFELFYDEQKRIRKLVYEAESCSGDSSRKSINYYDTTESLIYQIYYEDVIPESSILKGDAYFDHGNITDVSFIELIENKKVEKNNTSYLDFKKKIISKHAFKTIKSLRNSPLLNDESLLTHKRVVLRKPSKGESAFINSPRARLLESPELDSKVISDLVPFDTVYILEVGKSLNINPWGDNSWFKTKVFMNSKELTGWIYGVFLENIEDEK